MLVRYFKDEVSDFLDELCRAVMGRMTMMMTMKVEVMRRDPGLPSR